MQSFYVIRRTNQGGGYVTNPGSLHSYTKNKLDAMKFATYTAADNHRCIENEVVETVRLTLV